VEVAYTRRWYANFTATENLDTPASAYSPYSITAPLDPRLPNGGGYTVSGLYDVNPTLFGQVKNLITNASNYGNWYSYFNGLDITFNARTEGGVTIQGGTSTGQSVADACGVRANLPELNVGIGPGLNGSTVSATSPYCHVAFGVLTQVRGLAAYTIPKVDILVSTVFQSKPGALLAANYAVPNAAVVPSLGRNLAGNAPNVTVNLVAPGTMYGDRINELDFRIAKNIKLSSKRVTVGVDLYNALNSSAILTYNAGFVPNNGPGFAPISVLTPRIFRISAEFNF
jgi:hypothetical protein